MLLKADARHIPLRDETVQCVVTSPPFWGLTDYRVEGQLGLEPTPEEYITNVVTVFREVRRVRRKDGTLWLNLGDSYAGSNKGMGVDGTAYGGEKQRTNSGSMGLPVRGQRLPRGARRWGGGDSDAVLLKPKDLIGIPWRVAFALQADGWWLRSDCIYAKKNPMPESVTDRPTRSHEYLFLLTKSARYYYDSEAIREPSSPDTHARYARGRSKTHKYTEGGPGNQTIAKTFQHMRKPGVHPKSAPPGSGIRANESFSSAVKDVVDFRNKRSVWWIPTQPYSGAHFATFSEKLVEPCILAGTSERGCCPECGSPWEREVKSVSQGWDGSKYGERVVEASGGLVSGGTKKSTLGSSNGRLTNILETKGWRPTCDHKEEPNPCVVLDPFVGSGTTVKVAKRFNRIGIGCDLAYQEIAVRRTSNVQRQLVGMS